MNSRFGGGFERPSSPVGASAVSKAGADLMLLLMRGNVPNGEIFGAKTDRELALVAIKHGIKLPLHLQHLPTLPAPRSAEEKDQIVQANLAAEQAYEQAEAADLKDRPQRRGGSPPQAAQASSPADGDDDHDDRRRTDDADRRRRAAKLTGKKIKRLLTPKQAGDEGEDAERVDLKDRPTRTGDRADPPTSSAGEAGAEDAGRRQRAAKLAGKRLTG